MGNKKLTILVNAHVAALCAERLEASSVGIRTTRRLGGCYSNHGSTVAKNHDEGWVCVEIKLIRTWKSPSGTKERIPNSGN